MKIALLDKRLGTHGGHEANTWRQLKGVDITNNAYFGAENTFAIMEAVGELTGGPLEEGTDYSVLEDYDLIYVRLRGNIYGPEDGHLRMEELRKAVPHPIIIAYCDEWVNHIDWTPKTWVGKAAKFADAITCGFGPKYEGKAFRKMGITNYYHLPYAGPVNHWKNWFKPRIKKKFVVAGMWHIRSFLQQGRGDAVHTRTLEIFKYLQNRHDMECWFFLNFDGWKSKELIQESADQRGLKIKLLEHMSNTAFHETMADALIFIEEYPCPSFSRATVVSAAVGTPQIGTDMNEPSIGCFPDLTINYGDWKRWRTLADRLIEDEDFWVEQRDAGFKNCNYYWYPAFKQRLIDLYNELKEKRNHN